ncbi:porin [Bacteroides sp. 51]|uniref:porin n=1 Tax=Bacteroides sp. 51 TaxID=2302938 RepID=UPI0013D7FB30|nr:porin [Bacteroides sp. 51]NDV80715.1 porin [Bacteroides sp. 51]
MKKTIIFLTIFLLSAYTQVRAQIDDDIEYDEFTESLSEANTRGQAVINKYRMGDGVRFSSRDNSYGININGYVQTNMFVQKYPGDDDMYTRWRMRRARIRLNGQVLNDKIRYRIGLDFVKGSEADSEGASMLQDAWVQYRPWGNNKLAITFGQRNTPTDNRELLMSSNTLQLNERSKLSSIYGTVREVGLFAEGTYRVGGKGYLRPSLALTDGNGAMSKGKRYGGMKVGGRLNYLPFGLFRMSGETRQGDMVYELSPKLLIGGAYSYSNGTSDRRGGRDSGSILYMDDDGNYALPDYSKFVADFIFKYRGWSFIGEFAKSWAHVSSSITQRVRNDGSTTPNFEVDGVQDVEAYIKNRMNLGSAFNLQGGYMFRSFWSVDARYTHINPDKYSYMNNTLYYARNDVYELSVSKYLTKSYAAKIQATFGLVKTDGEVRTHRDTTSDGYEKTFNIMMQIAF